MNTEQWLKLRERKKILIVCAICLTMVLVYASILTERLPLLTFERTLPERIANEETIFFAQVQSTENLERIMKNVAAIYHVQFPKNRTYSSEDFAQIAILKIRNDAQYEWAILTRKSKDNGGRRENHIIISSQKMANHLLEKQKNKQFQSNAEWQAIDKKKNNALYMNLASLPMEIAKSNQIIRALVRPYSTLTMTWSESGGMLTLLKKAPSEVMESTQLNDTALSGNQFPFSIESAAPLKQGKILLETLGQENKGLIQGMEGILQAAIQQSVGEKITAGDFAPYLQARTSIFFEESGSGKTIVGLSGSTEAIDDDMLLNKSRTPESLLKIRTQQFFAENSRTDVTLAQQQERGKRQDIHAWEVQPFGRWYIGRKEHQYIISNERALIEKMTKETEGHDNKFLPRNKAEIGGIWTSQWLEKIREKWLFLLLAKNATIELLTSSLEKNARYIWSVGHTRDKTNIRWQSIEKNRKTEEAEGYIK